MTDLHIGERAQTAVGHPLDRLTADEIRTAADVLRDSKLLGDSVRLPVLALEEPPKAEVLAFTPGTDFDRRVRAVLLDTATGSSRSAVVSVTRKQVDAVTELDPLVDGQPPIMLEEFELVDAIVKGDAGLARRDGPPWCHRSRSGLRVPAVRRGVRPAGRGRSAAASRAVVPAAPAVGPPVGAPDRRLVAYVDLIDARGRRDRRRRRRAGAGRGGQLRRPRIRRPGRAPRSAPSRSPSPKARASRSTATW